MENRLDVRSDSVMISNGLRFTTPLESRDPSVWTRTKQERVYLSKVKKIKGHFNSIPRKLHFLFDKLTITLKKNNKFPKQVIVVKCWQHDIPFIIDKYEDCILKYKWNNKTYKPTELPS